MAEADSPWQIQHPWQGYDRCPSPCADDEQLSELYSQQSYDELFPESVHQSWNAQRKQDTDIQVSESAKVCRHLKCVHKIMVRFSNAEIV